MKSANASVVSSLTDDTNAVKKAIANPTALHYKGINITPGGFMAAELCTVRRLRAPIYRRLSARFPCSAPTPLN